MNILNSNSDCRCLSRPIPGLQPTLSLAAGTPFLGATDSFEILNWHGEYVGGNVKCLTTVLFNDLCHESLTLKMEYLYTVGGSLHKSVSVASPYNIKNCRAIQIITF